MFFFLLWGRWFCYRKKKKDLNSTKPQTQYGNSWGQRYTCLRKNDHTYSILFYCIYFYPLESMSFNPFFFNKYTDTHISKVSCSRSQRETITRLRLMRKPKTCAAVPLHRSISFRFVSRCSLSTFCEPGTWLHPVIVVVVAVIMEVRIWGQERNSPSSASSTEPEMTINKSRHMNKSYIWGLFSARFYKRHPERNI